MNLSRVTRGEMRREKIDMTALAHSIAEELQRTQPERQVEWRIADGLTAHGDARLLRVALENLFGNAWKFTSRKPSALIEFGVIEDASSGDTSGGEPTYFVRDNGVGFDMAYASKLFGAFQRLHKADEFEGTGIGLATVHRVISRHNGRVWAEGELNKGATFYFTL